MILLIFAGSVCFVVGSYWIFNNSNDQNLLVQVFPKIIGLAGMTFFSLTGINSFIKLFDPGPGMVLTDEGILDRSRTGAHIFIRWDDIIGWEEIRVNRNKMLNIYVKNPEDYINNSNQYSRFWMKLNGRMSGTPITISTTGLRCSTEDLMDILEQNTNLTND